MNSFWRIHNIELIYLGLLLSFVNAQAQTQEITQGELEYKNKFDEVLSSNLNDTSKLRFLVNIIHSLIAKNSRYPFIYYKIGFETSESLDNEYWDGELNLVLGELYNQILDKEKCAVALNQAAQNFKAAKFPIKELDARIRLSLFYGSNESAEKALNEAYTALEMSNKIFL